MVKRPLKIKYLVILCLLEKQLGNSYTIIVVLLRAARRPRDFEFAANAILGSLLNFVHRTSDFINIFLSTYYLKSPEKSRALKPHTISLRHLGQNNGEGGPPLNHRFHFMFCKFISHIAQNFHFSVTFILKHRDVVHHLNSFLQLIQ